MKIRSFLRMEQRLICDTVKFVVGVDEAGRGSLAGPMSMAMVVYDNRLVRLKGLTDSKLVAELMRESLFEQITKKFVWAHTFIDIDVIDNFGLTEATYRGFRNLITQTEVQLGCPIDYILMDGKQKWKLPRPTESIIGGDSKIRSIAAASIIAKVKRDRLMKLLGKEFGGYGFENNVGYGTREHMSLLESSGPCALHRVSFAPVKYLIAS